MQFENEPNSLDGEQRAIHPSCNLLYMLRYISKYKLGYFTQIMQTYTRDILYGLYQLLMNTLCPYLSENGNCVHVVY